MEETSGPKTQGADKQQASCQQAHQESRKKRRSRRRRRRRQGHEGEGSHSTTRQQQVASQDNKKTSETTNATTVEAQYSTRKTSSSSTDSTTRDITDSCNIQTNLGETSTIPDQEIAPPSLQQHRQQGEIVVVTLQDKNNNIVDSTQTQFQSIQQTPNNPSDQLRVQAATTTTLNQSSVNAVRVLFQDQHQQQQQLLLQQRTGSGAGGLYVDPGNRAEAGLEQRSSNIEHPGQTPVSASVIGLNRQLIERQLEAIQAADSERWNFDFRQSRPLRIEGHRYQVVQCPRPSCRTLNERSDPNTGIRLYQNNQQQQQHQERLPTGQGSDCKQTHRDKSDRGQDDARQ